MERSVKRIKHLRRELEKRKLFPYFISDLNNIRYLTGFPGSYAFMLFDRKDTFFISDSRYSEYARSLTDGFAEFLLPGDDLNVTLRGLLKRLNKKNLFLEEHSLTLSSFTLMKKSLRGIKLEPGGSEVNSIRMVKDEGEIAIIEKAAELTDSCFRFLTENIRPGMTEWDVAVEIENYYRKNGCRSSSFDAIVASGSGSSMPHYETSMEKKIEKGDVLLIDMGCIYRGYNSDLTRTIFVNSVDREIEKIYGIVKEAQESAIKAVRPGISTGKLDSVARDIITSRGYGEMFGHSLGHGLGVEVHELPAVKKKGETRLKKNMVITIEPGIYLPGTGGVRIEDMVMVTGKGCRVLTESPKDIIVI
jgi:Xaa-Pro aminopeptidase